MFYCFFYWLDCFFEVFFNFVFFLEVVVVYKVMEGYEGFIFFEGVIFGFFKFGYVGVDFKGKVNVVDE